MIESNGTINQRHDDFASPLTAGHQWRKTDQLQRVHADGPLLGVA